MVDPAVEVVPGLPVGLVVVVVTGPGDDRGLPLGFSPKILKNSDKLNALPGLPGRLSPIPNSLSAACTRRVSPTPGRPVLPCASVSSICVPNIQASNRNDLKE